MQIVSGALVSTLIFGPIFGYMSDNVDARVIVPTTFFVRGLIAFSFRYIDDPTKSSSYILSVLLILVSVMQFLCVEVLFMRNMKSSIRGTLSGMAIFFSSIGMTMFVRVGGILFDKVGPWAPFQLLGTADVSVFVISLIFLACGLIKRND